MRPLILQKETSQGMLDNSLKKSATNIKEPFILHKNRGFLFNNRAATACTFLTAA